MDFRGKLMLIKAFSRVVFLCLQFSLLLNAVSSKHKNDEIEEKIHFFSRHNVNSPQKIKRNGILIRRPNAKANILICHGFMCDKFDINFFHLIFNKYNTMTFDFRAHGEEIEGQYYTFGRDESYDVIAAVNFLKDHPLIGDKPLIIYGFSGGAVAACIAAAVDKNLCTAMILDCPFDSTDKLLERALGKVKINLFGYEIGLPGSSFFQSYAYSPYIQNLLKTILRTFANMDSKEINTMICPVYPEEAVKYIPGPVFLIGCYNDDKVPEEAIRCLYNNLGKACKGGCVYKQAWLTNARRHFDVIFEKMRVYIAKSINFIERCLKGNVAKKGNALFECDPN